MEMRSLLLGPLLIRRMPSRRGVYRPGTTGTRGHCRKKSRFGLPVRGRPRRRIWFPDSPQAAVRRSGDAGRGVGLKKQR